MMMRQGSGNGLGLRGVSTFLSLLLPTAPVILYAQEHSSSAQSGEEASSGEEDHQGQYDNGQSPEESSAGGVGVDGSQDNVDVLPTSTSSIPVPTITTPPVPTVTAPGYSTQDLEGIEVILYRTPETPASNYQLDITPVVQEQRTPISADLGVHILSVAGYSGQLVIPEVSARFHLDPLYARLGAGKVFHQGTRRNAEEALPVEKLGYQDNGSLGTELFERFPYEQTDLNLGSAEAMRFTAGAGGIMDMTGSLKVTIDAMVGLYLADATQNKRDEFQLTSKRGSAVLKDRKEGEPLTAQDGGMSLVPTYGLRLGVEAIDWLCVSGAIDVIHAGEGTRNTVAAYGGYIGACHRF